MPDSAILITMIEAVLFDMDGVLADTEDYSSQAGMLFFKELGIPVDQKDFIGFIGSGEDEYIGGVARLYGHEVKDIAAAKIRMYQLYETTVQGRLEPLPGVVTFIRACREHGLKTAVVTSADSLKMQINLEQLRLDPASFDELICGSDVERKKPSPDIYHLAARRVGVDPSGCLVVEDAVNGVLAAKRAGMVCAALTTSFSPEHLRQAGADVVVSGFPALMKTELGKLLLPRYAS